ncbi:MAG TPA: hypothetical protein VGT41_02790 [Candidatus Babeliales bacterium]|nr:hypothetical protein [Candidatus Babeliales bacterium]
MNKNLLSIAIFSLSVIVLNPCLEAMAPAPRRLVASEMAQELTVRVINQLPVPAADVRSFFDRMCNENAAGQLSLFKADALITATVADLQKRKNGELLANSLTANYYKIIRRQLR